MDNEFEPKIGDSEENKTWGEKDEEHWRAISNIHYYLREGYYGTAILLCDGRLRVTSDTPLSILKGVCLTLLGKIPEATRHLESITDEEYSLGWLYALKWAHSCAFNPDNRSIVELESEISTKSRDEKTTSYAFASAAEVLFFSGDFHKAKQLLDTARRRSDERNAKYYCLLGWIDLAMGRNQKSTQELFEKSAGQGYPDGYVGRCRILEGHHSAVEMRTVAKELTITSYQFVPGHIERCKAAIMTKDWNATLDAIQNSNVNEGGNPYLEVLRTVHAICFAGYNGELVNTLSILQKSLEENETSNHVLFAKIAALATSLSAKDKTVLVFAKNLLTKALQITRKPEYLSLALRIACGLGETKEVNALSAELVAMECDDPYGSLGTVISALMNNKLSDAKSQYDLLLAANPKLSDAPVYYLLGEIIAKQTAANSFEKLEPFIENCIEKLRNQIQMFPFSLEYLLNLQTDLLYLCLEQTLNFAPLVPIKSSNDCLKLCEKILTLIVDAAPGLAHCVYLKAKVYYLSSNFNGAEMAVKLALEKNETLTDAYILKAQIILDRGGKITDAENALSTGLNFNFALRDTSLYHLIKAKTLKKKNENEEAVKTLKAALKIPKKESSKNLLMPKESADTHKISVQLELIDTFQLMKRTRDAETAMEEAMNEWNGKPEQDQLIISQAQLYVTRGMTDKALAVLGKIDPAKSNYHLSRVKMAEIYLEEKKDRRMYAQCYRDLLNVAPTPSSYSTLGDAFMSIQQPEEAISYYEQALKMQNKDILLAEKIGEAYVLAHFYAKAVNFYESSMNIYKDKGMRLKLANLLLRLRNFEKCERILRAPLEQDKNPMDPETIQSHVHFLMVLSQLQHLTEHFTEAFESMSQAKMLQLRLLSKNDNQGNATVKREASKICSQTAELYLRRRDVTKATECYKEAVSYHEQDIKSYLALAHIYMQQNKLQLCNQMCMTVLAIERDNDEATLMMADLLYLKNEGEQAIVHFMQLLSRNPNHYHALARVVELSWRIGDNDHSEKYLQRAVENNPRAAIDAGYNFCKGLHEWFCRKPNDAIQAFNRARNDPTWGEKATYNIIEICLNPDNEIIGGEVFEDGNGADNSDRLMTVKTAGKFLSELKYKSSSDSKYTLMENFILLQSGEKNNINIALNNCVQMNPENENVGNVGAILCAARAYTMLKQPQKAKQLLKRVIGHNWTLDDADYLEKCWLLLADSYISANKSVQANRMIELALQYNASCMKAYEFLGYLKEKETKYAEACQHYEKAWTICRQQNASTGYKLAFCYLKCKKLFECIETCHTVLKQHPHYPKIKKEVMDRARALIRT